MKDQQKQHLIDMMKADEELGLYDEPNETLHEVALEFAKDHYEMYETSNLGSMHFGFIEGAKWQQEQDKKCYHPLPYRLAKSDVNYECTLCGKFI